jgi:hypothetical protein
MTTRELERLLDLLAKLSEQTSDGRLRDMIAEIRSACWDRLEVSA